MVSNHTSVSSHASQDGVVLYHTHLFIISFPGHGAISHTEAAPELGLLLLPFSEPLPYPSQDGDNGDKPNPSRSLLSVGTLLAYAAAVLPFSPSVPFLHTSNIQFSAFFAPDILQTLFRTTSKICFLGDALARAHYWAYKC